MSQATPEAGTEPCPSPSWPTIKALKAAHTIDAAPERTVSRRIAAEEPVTARIRRRSESATAIELPVEPEPVATAGGRRPAPAAMPAPPEEPTPVAVIHPFPKEMPVAPARPQPAYRQQLSRSRRQNRPAAQFVLRVGKRCKANLRFLYFWLRLTSMQVGVRRFIPSASVN